MPFLKYPANPPAVSDDATIVTRGVEQELGPVDVLVNNAGDVKVQQHFLTTDEAWWDHFIRTNLTSHYLCSRRVATGMVKRGSGSIINMSSGGATKAHRGMVAYDASKGGIEAFTRALALELAPYGVRVNALVPGLIATNPSHLEPAARARRDGSGCRQPRGRTRPRQRSRTRLVAAAGRGARRAGGRR